MAIMREPKECHERFIFLSTNESFAVNVVGLGDCQVANIFKDATFITNICNVVHCGWVGDDEQKHTGMCSE